MLHLLIERTPEKVLDLWFGHMRFAAEATPDKAIQEV